MKYCVMILSVGDIPYAKWSKPVLTHYFERHGIPYVFINESPNGIDLKGSHPSWWKLLAHTILPDYDYIICWDLDLLPITPSTEVLSDFSMTTPTMAWDTGIKLHPELRNNPNLSFLKHFKYNGGLIGIPHSHKEFFESVFYDYAPGILPSWEQYYLNNAVHDKGIDIHELLGDINVLYGLPGFECARLQHYTYKQEAKSKIEDHYKKYMSLV